MSNIDIVIEEQERELEEVEETKETSEQPKSIIGSLARPRMITYEHGQVLYKNPITKLELVFGIELHFYGQILNYKNTEIGFIQSPHGNCQEFAIMYFNQLVNHCKQDTNLILEHLQPVYQNMGKKQISIDIDRKLNPIVEKIFTPDMIVFKADYTNTFMSGLDMTEWRVRLDMALNKYNQEKEQKKVTNGK